MSDFKDHLYGPRHDVQDLARRIGQRDSLARQLALGVGDNGGFAELTRRVNEHDRFRRATEDAFGGATGLQEMMTRAAEQQRLFSEAIPSAHLAAIQERLRFGVQFPTEFQSRMASIAELAQRSLAGFATLEQSPIQKALAEIQSNLTIHASQFAKIGSQMAKITEPWALLSDRIGSVGAFVELEAFSSAARSLPSFSTDHQILTATELGAYDAAFVEAEAGEDEEEREETYTKAGRNVALVAFPTRSYPSVLQAAGWTEMYAPLPMPRLEDGTEVKGFIYDPADHALVTHVEAHLRTFVEGRMQDRYGPNWLQQHVKPDRLTEWRQRRDASVARGQPSLTLINYADFSELKDIICKRQPWTEVFRATFNIREVFTTSMIRLHGMRLELAHSRLLTNTARLMLEVEANAIFRAIGAIQLS